MSDHTAGGPVPQARTPRVEFRVYCTMIFLVALPFVALAWVAVALRYMGLPEEGPLDRAWRLAFEITPFIFWP
jgi:hypothetical protein